MSSVSSVTPVIGVESSAGTDRSAESGPSRWTGMDAMRLYASLGVIWIHAVQHFPAVLGRFAVPFFAASAGFLVVLHLQRRRDIRFSDFAGLRALRLLIPFAVWTFIYGAVRSVGAGVTQFIQVPDLSLSVLWTGSTHHLWFLPFVWVLSLFAYVTTRLATGRERVVAPVLVLAAVALLLSPNPTPHGADWYTLRLSLDTLPAGLFGIAYGLLWSKESAWKPSPSVWYAVLMVALLVGMAWAGIERNKVLENLCGVAALLGCLRMAAPRWLEPLTRIAELPYGVYLSHVLFVEGLQDVAQIASVADSATLEIAIFAAASLLSIAFTVAAVRLGQRWLVGG
jgi:peptidoglycan/LPS O-acetylase OafA/YrhL